jgi:hypothetical protein
VDQGIRYMIRRWFGDPYRCELIVQRGFMLGHTND